MIIDHNGPFGLKRDRSYHACTQVSLRMLQVLPILTDYQEEGESYVCTDVSVSKTIRFIDTHDYCKADTSHWLTGLQHGIYITVLTMVCTLSAGGLIYWKWYNLLVP